jgi:polar amino acid transport system substrate-binding protein
MVAAITASAAQPATIVLGGDPYCPVNCEAEGVHQGFAIDMARAIFEPKGYTVDYQVIPWTRAVAQGAAGQINGIVGASPDKPGYTYPKQNAGTEKFVFMVRASDPFSYAGLASLKGKRIGIVKDYDVSGELGQFIKDNQNNPAVIDAVSGDQAGELNVKKLAGDRLDIVIDNESTLLYLASTLGLAHDLKVVDAGGVPSPIYIAFSTARPETPALIRIWDDGVSELRSSGRLAKILAGYGIKDWQ